MHSKPFYFYNNTENIALFTIWSILVRNMVGKKMVGKNTVGYMMWEMAFVKLSSNNYTPNQIIPRGLGLTPKMNTSFYVMRGWKLAKTRSMAPSIKGPNFGRRFTNIFTNEVCFSAPPPFQTQPKHKHIKGWDYFVPLHNLITKGYGAISSLDVFEFGLNLRKGGALKQKSLRI
jgi:hypothetical protein